MLLDSLARNWWMFLIRGICAILFGIFAFTWPGITLASLVLVFGIYAIIDGLTALGVGISGGTLGRPWWQMILVGILSLIAGGITFVWPGLTAVVLLALIASWAIVRGIMEIAAAIRLRSVIEHEGWLIFSGVCSLLFGILLFIHPRAGALAVLWVIGAYAIFFGTLLVGVAFRLHSIKSRTMPDAGPHAGGLAT
jgi:uncharacterized membrane protein HdeD (DUF308 family)